ncbi:Hypothetical predicted protein [Mytilus galloprovincialis]|uniref:Peptidase A2 domain-containing protein n=1 Tax=Mytilus galloprovincialis TaxID=29158 RepID=A0A8B6GF83_MYTGA|nr:Hypothetical predicted protein [Mytilus galloprovincialis]
MEEYKPFMSDGFISIVDDTTLQPIKILRDTGASQTLLLEARNKVVAEPIVTSEPVVDVKSPEDDAELYPACVVTRAMARKQQNQNLQEGKFDYMDLSDTFIADIEGPGSSEKAITRPPSVNKNVIMPWPDVNSHSLDRKNLSEEQHKDPEKKEEKIKKPKFKAGTRVRITKKKGKFEKGYTTRWTKEIFVIEKVLNTIPFTYKIIDLKGEEITGSFYEQELQMTKF